MSEESKVESLILEHLRAIRSQVSRIGEMQNDHGHRLTRIELGVAGIRRDQAGDAQGMAHLETRFDRMNEKIERIERRLEIAD